MSKLMWVGIAVLIVVVEFLLITFLQWLWNLIIPGMTGWEPITFWQMFGLNVLVNVMTYQFNAAK